MKEYYKDPDTGKIKVREKEFTETKLSTMQHFWKAFFGQSQLLL